MDDVTREHEWQPSLLEASQDPSGPTRVGTRKRYVSEFLGKRVENTYEAIEVDPGRRVVYRTTRESTLQATSEVEWADEGTGTRVTLSVDGRPTGVLRFVPRSMIEEASLRQLRDTLRRLKEHLESSTP
jgi:carbon monoxide dehydrogenase subunit G